jgi:hypothetical protein
MLRQWLLPAYDGSLFEPHNERFLLAAKRAARR